MKQGFHIEKPFLTLMGENLYLSRLVHGELGACGSHERSVWSHAPVVLNVAATPPVDLDLRPARSGVFGRRAQCPEVTY